MIPQDLTRVYNEIINSGKKDITELKRYLGSSGGRVSRVDIEGFTDVPPFAEVRRWPFVQKRESGTFYLITVPNDTNQDLLMPFPLTYSPSTLFILKPFYDVQGTSGAIRELLEPAHLKGAEAVRYRLDGLREGRLYPFQLVETLQEKGYEPVDTWLERRSTIYVARRLDEETKRFLSQKLVFIGEEADTKLWEVIRKGSVKVVK